MAYKNDDYKESDKHELKKGRDDTPDCEDDDNEGCIGCMPLVYGFLLSIATAGALYAAPYFSNSQQKAQPSKLEQGLAPKSDAKTLAEKVQTEQKH